MDLFKKNSYTDLVEKATGESLTSENLELNLAVVDAVQRDPNGPRDVVKAIKKRLAHKSTKVQMLCLTLMDMCVKNCGQRLYTKLCEKEFLTDYVKMIQDKKTSPAVRDAMLDYLQLWAAGTTSDPAAEVLSETCIRLKNEGFNFPHRDLMAVTPIPQETKTSKAHVPSRAQPPQVDNGGFFSTPGMPGAVLAPPPAGGMQPQQVYYQVPGGVGSYYLPPPVVQPYSVAVPAGSAQASSRLIVSNERYRNEFNVMKETVTLFSEALAYADPSQENIQENPLIQEFYERCMELQPRLVAMIGQVQDEQLLTDMIALNDNLVSRLEMYHSYVSQAKRQGTSNPAPVAVQPVHSPVTVQPVRPAQPTRAPSANLIDFSSDSISSPPPPQAIQELLGDGAPMDERQLAADMAALGIMDEFGAFASSPAAASSSSQAPAVNLPPPADDFDQFIQERSRNRSMSHSPNDNAPTLSANPFHTPPPPKPLSEDDVNLF